MALEELRKKLKFYVEEFLEIMGDNNRHVYVRFNIKGAVSLLIGIPICPINEYDDAGISFEGIISGKILCTEGFNAWLDHNGIVNNSWMYFTYRLHTVLEEFGLIEEFFAELECKLLEVV